MSFVGDVNLLFLALSVCTEASERYHIAAISHHNIYLAACLLTEVKSVALRQHNKKILYMTSALQLHNTFLLTFISNPTTCPMCTITNGLDLS